jgi:hypothetical protein
MRSAGYMMAIATLAGAAAGSGCNKDEPQQPRDAAVFDLSIELPEGCPPAQANEKGVGIPCTPGGGQCMASGVPAGLRCTCDAYSGIQLVGVPCVCTMVGLNPDPANVPDACTTIPSGYCGTDATCCPYVNAGFYCSPNVCLPGGACLVFTSGPGVDAGM